MEKATSITADSRQALPVSTVEDIWQRDFGFLPDKMKEAAPIKAAKYKARSITDRDGYVLRRALVYDIARIQSLPPRKQQWGEIVDMCAMARSHDVSTMGAHAADVYANTSVRVEIWPGQAVGDAGDLDWAVAFSEARVGILEEPAKPKKTNRGTLAGGRS